MMFFLTLAFLLLYAILIFFYYKGWKRLESFTADDHPEVFVTVVVAARNEEKKIPLLLQEVMTQNYTEHLYEIIVIDDFSNDKTAEVILTYFPKVKLMQPDCPPQASSKKRAIETGVRAAKGELIIVSDADCSVSAKWISTIAAFYKKTKASFIAAPVKYKHNSSVLQIFQSLDFMMLQGITAASVSSGFHNMCNGANLAYTRQEFIAVNGFENIDRVATGDDMLLMHKIWKLNPAKIFYLKAQEAIVFTDPMPTWKDFFMQRKRWASKTLVYEDKKIIAVLAFVYLFNLWFLILLTASIFDFKYLWLALIFLLIKFLIELPFLASVADFFKEKKLVAYLLPFQPLHIIYTVVAGLISQFGTYEWKGRRTR